MERSGHQALYKQSGFKSSNSLASLRHFVNYAVRAQQGKQRELLITSKRFKVSSLDDTEEFISALEDEELVKANVKLLKQGKKHQALSTLCDSFARRAENADVFLSCNGLQSLVSCFQSAKVEILQSAALCSVNLTAAASTSSTLMALASTLINFLHGSDPIMQEYCAWALGNLAGDSPSNALVLQGQGCVHALLELISTRHHLEKQSRSECVMFTLINLAAESSSKCIGDMQENGIHTLIQMLFKSICVESSLSFELGWLVNSIYSKKETFSRHYEQYPTIANLICDRLNEMLNLDGDSRNERNILPLVHCLANMMAMDVNLARAVLENNLHLFTSFCLLLASNVEIIQRETFRALLNCMAGLCSRVLITFHPELSHAVLDMCHHTNSRMAVQALTVVETMTKTSSFVDSYLIKQGVIDRLVPLLRNETDIAVIDMTLSILSSLIPSCSPQVQEELKRKMQDVQREAAHAISHHATVTVS